MPEGIEKSLLDLDFAALTRRTFTPSPAAWEDQVLYFLLLDRFSDGNEKGGYRDNDGRPVTRRHHAAVPARGPRPRRLRHLAPRRRRLAGRHAQGADEQARLPPAARRHRPVGQPAVPPGRVRAELPRLRHPELPRRRPALRHARGVPRLRPRRPRAGHLRHPRHHRPPHRQRLHLRPGPLPDARPGHRGGGTTTRAGTAGPTPSRASTTATAGRRCRSSAPDAGAAWRRPGRTARSGRASSSGPTCSSARGTSPTGTTTPSTSRGTCSA